MSKNHNHLYHIGIIPDGNRSWAASHNLAPEHGHYQGYLKVKEVLEWCREIGVKVMTVYAFSTENWDRPSNEVLTLMQLLLKALSSPENLDEFEEKGVKVRIIGQKERLGSDIKRAIHHVESRTSGNNQILLQLAVSYGGRAEITDAVKRIIQHGITPAQVDEKLISDMLWTADTVDPDILIRTSGVMRLSNFLPWQAVYAELFFPKTLWPNFSRQEFDMIVEEFGWRRRKFGQ